MAVAVKKTISLPPDLAREIEEMAREEGRPVSAVIQDALRIAKKGKAQNRVLPGSKLLEPQGQGKRDSHGTRP